MKIKIVLLGLFFANTIMHPIYADQYKSQSASDQMDVVLTAEKVHAQPKKKEKDEDEAQNLVKLSATVEMGPALVYQDGVFSTKSSFQTGLKFKADVPKAWCMKDAAVCIGINCTGKDFTGNGAVTIGKMVTIGYTSSIFGYKKAGPSFPISVGATVLQIQYEAVFGYLQARVALETPIPLRVGLFDKNKSDESDESQEQNAKKEEGSVNRLDKDQAGPFNFKNNIPAIAYNLAFVTDQWNIGLSGLFRCTDYTHGTNFNQKSLEKKYHSTTGVNLGIQYQFVPKIFTAIVQGIYVHGLGEYISRLAVIQNDEAREEMCAAYYIDKTKDHLFYINAWGGGATLEYCATPKWTYSIGASCLRTGRDYQKPPQAFYAQWDVIPKVAYALNKYFTLSGGYSLVKELKLDPGKDNGIEHTWFGNIEFSL